MIKGLPRDCFVCTDVFQIEQQRIFQRHWIAVASASDFGSGPSSFVVVDIGDFSIILVRQESGKIAAFHNVCRHRGTRLLTEPCGDLKNQCITCPYHAWTYDNAGRLTGAPNMADVPDFDRSQYGLLPVACAQWGGMVFVHLHEDTSEFTEDMGPLLSRLANWHVDKLCCLLRTLEYDVAANWKLLFHNYSECYHCPTVHPDLNRVTPYRSATNDLTEGAVLGGPMQLAEGFESVTQSGSAVGPLIAGLNDEQRRSVYYYTVFPNMFVSAHPDYVMIHRLEAVDPGNTRVQCHFLTSSESTDEGVAGACQMWDTINRQDWRVCELTQQGVTSPAYRPGPYSCLEPMPVAFDRHYRDVMDDAMPAG
ncbi:MAG: aromatic ring-hydroxylating oxygenase subunit alpha [Pirellulaceae bacterium]